MGMEEVVCVRINVGSAWMDGWMDGWKYTCKHDASCV